VSESDGEIGDAAQTPADAASADTHATKGNQPSDAPDQQVLDAASAGTHAMRVDILGRIRNSEMGAQHGLLPVFEAIVNSIHSTEDRFGKEVARLGKVEVTIHRARQTQLAGLGGRPAVEPVRALTIVDNGVGFTDANQGAFETADSTAKIDRGGKGVGRFTWLVVFERAVVASTYRATSGERRRRTFVFKPSTSGIDEHRDEPIDEGELETRIELVSPKKKFVDALRKSADVIAEHIFEHCFNWFVLGRCPQIRLIDEHPDGSDVTVVNDRIKELNIAPPVALSVGAHALGLRHVEQKYKVGRKHLAHLCANERVVTSFPLTQVSDLDAAPTKGPDGEAVVHHVFVSGAALDEAVNATRTRLDLPDGEPLLEQAGALDLKKLREAIGADINQRLAPVLQAEREENFKRVESYVRSVQPEYRHLLTRRPEQVQRVKWSDSRQQMDENLYRIQQELEADVRQRQAEVEKKIVEEKTDLETIAADLYRIVSETNEAGQANLVRYVTKRRAVLQLIGKMISRFQGPALEEHIHRIVFPLKKTADDLALDDHNLWLVDDSLAFYEFVASDIPFSKNAAAPVDGLKRPDILAFKTGDPYQHVAIVEFKRPDREDSNPVTQLVEYAQLLRKGGAVDALGKTLPGIAKSVRIDAYAVCTLTPKVVDMLPLSPGDLREVENEWRWYGHQTALNMTIEVLDYRAFIRRAEQRNRTFFTKLGLT
jgi:hypothetical protein